MLVFDLETNGLLDDVSVVHCLCIHDTDTGETEMYDDQPSTSNASIRKGLTRLMCAPQIAGHNVIAYDLPVIEKLYGLTYEGATFDTLVLARLAYPEIKGVDYQLQKKGELPGKLIGSHSLKAWGYRLGVLKGEFDGPWHEWTQEMANYCEQDIKVTLALMAKKAVASLPSTAIEIEMEVAKIIERQSRYGFAFDEAKAEKLYSRLLKRQRELTKRLQGFFPAWYASQGEFTPKRNDRGKGYVAGATFTKVKYTEFNPASRYHVADRLKKNYGWTPTEFTEDGAPKLDEKILSSLNFPESKLLAEYYIVSKRIGQLAEGSQGWLQAVKKGRIHGRVNTCGAVTRRMTHSTPNVAQTPRVGSPYGKECRELFRASDGRVLVGVDASGLELRCLAHYMSKYDDGAYAEIVSKGDVHGRHQQALGLETRDKAKTFIYAFLYGAGDFKIGTVLGRSTKYGKQVREKFLEAFPALAQLKSKVEQVASRKGVLLSLDGAPMQIRSNHAALNTLLQGAGALLMKKALVICDADLQVRHGLKPGVDYEFVANIHDEWQIETVPHLADLVGTTAVRALEKAGESFSFACLITGKYKIGKTWAETH
jgi:DNA polymerase-1